MTQTHFNFLMALTLTFAGILWLTPWWLSVSVISGIGSITAWAYRSTIIQLIPKQFIKEFSAMALTLSVCILWFWQLNHWLPSLV